jgi:Zn-dependent protease with chaperone function
MTISYLLRLVCLSFASFFLIHTCLGWLAAAITPAALGLARTLRPRLAAWLLFTLRIAPCALALAWVLGLCVPSYLWFEAEGVSQESVGLICSFIALLGAAIWVISIRRSWRALQQSKHYAASCELQGRQARLRGQGEDVLLVEGKSPIVVLEGLWRTRVVISRQIMEAFSADELDVVLSHERAHRASWDNLKRFLLLLTPDVLPFFRSFATLEKSWSKYTEWAADDHAVQGDQRRAVSLASALLLFARIGVAHTAPALLSHAAEDADLSARIDRLLHVETASEVSRWQRDAVNVSSCLAVGGALAIAILSPQILPSVHQLLEHLLR